MLHHSASPSRQHCYPKHGIGLLAALASPIEDRLDVYQRHNLGLHLILFYVYQPQASPWERLASTVTLVVVGWSHPPHWLLPTMHCSPLLAPTFQITSGTYSVWLAAWQCVCVSHFPESLPCRVLQTEASFQIYPQAPFGLHPTCLWRLSESREETLLGLRGWFRTEPHIYSKLFCCKGGNMLLNTNSRLNTVQGLV